LLLITISHDFRADSISALFETLRPAVLESGERVAHHPFCLFLSLLDSALMLPNLQASMLTFKPSSILPVQVPIQRWYSLSRHRHHSSLSPKPLKDYEGTMSYPRGGERGLTLSLDLSRIIGFAANCLSAVALKKPSVPKEGSRSHAKSIRTFSSLRRLTPSDNTFDTRTVHLVSNRATHSAKDWARPHFRMLHGLSGNRPESLVLYIFSFSVSPFSHLNEYHCCALSVFHLFAVPHLNGYHCGALSVFHLFAASHLNGYCCSALSVFHLFAAPH
jgi:hypothetical protein